MEIQVGARRSAGRAGRAFGTVFSGLFVVVGLGVTAGLVAHVVSELAVYRWDEAPCRIVDSRVVESGDDESPYRLEVRYRYEVGGVGRLGARAGLSDRTSASYDALRDRALRYPAGSDATCRTRPGRPEESVLEASFPWLALAAPLPLVFVAIGGIGLVATWRRRRDRPTAMTSTAELPQKLAVWLPIGLGAVFVAAGGAMLVFLSILPTARTLRAASWTPTPCTIVDSRVRSHQSDEGATYRVDVLYEYRAGGRTWRSNRFDYVPGASSGYDSKRRLVESYPEGLETTCFVDPGEPSRSVLRRGFGIRHLLGLAPLAFLVPGIGVLSWGLGRRRRRLGSGVAPRGESHHAVATAAAAATFAGGPSVLEPRSSPLQKVLGAIVVMLFWNGIVGVFVWQAVESWRRGEPDWFLTLFVTPFVLVGLVLVGAVGYFALAAFNPRPTLTVSDAAPRLGDRLQVSWRLRGAVGRLRRLRITLEGREEATYRRGTDTRTERRTFARGLVLDTTHPLQMRQGSTSVEIPGDLVPSFEATSNTVAWLLKLEGDIPRWPDVGDEFPITVRPRRPGGDQ